MGYSQKPDIWHSNKHKLPTISDVIKEGNKLYMYVNFILGFIAYYMQIFFNLPFCYLVAFPPSWLLFVPFHPMHLTYYNLIQYSFVDDQTDDSLPIN